jgi:hypothetical protein
MTDTITTNPLEFRHNNTTREFSSINSAWELALAEDRLREHDARIVALTNALHSAETEQITDGADPRLTTFWDRAGRIADHADYCEEYDRMAEALNGPRRSREYEVTLEVSVNVRIYLTTSGEGNEDAIDHARDQLDANLIIEAIQTNGNRGSQFAKMTIELGTGDTKATRRSISLG